MSLSPCAAARFGGYELVAHWTQGEFHHDVVLAHGRYQAIVPLGQGRRRSAFEHLAGEPGRRLRQLRARRTGGPRCWIARTASEHDLRFVLARTQDGNRDTALDAASFTVLWVDGDGVELLPRWNTLPVRAADISGARS